VTGDTLGDSQVNQPGFLAAGDDVDTAAQSGFCNHQESVGILHPAEGLGADCAKVIHGNPAQPLAEAGQAGESTFLHHRVQLPILIQATAQPNHFLDSVDDPQLAVFTAGHQQVKAIAAKINGSVSICAFRNGHEILRINVSTA